MSDYVVAVLVGCLIAIYDKLGGRPIVLIGYAMLSICVFFAVDLIVTFLEGAGQ